MPYLSVPVQVSMFVHIPGENYNGVFSANEYLTRTNLMKAYSEEAATPMIRFKSREVGGGNVAMDSARCANVSVLIRFFISFTAEAWKKCLPDKKKYIMQSKKVLFFNILTNPTQIIGDDKGYVKGIECIKMELGEPDASGRRRPIPIEGSEFVLDVDAVIMALARTPTPSSVITLPILKSIKKAVFLPMKKPAQHQSPAFLQAETLLPVLQQLSSLWAQAKLPQQLSTNISKRKNKFINKRSRICGFFFIAFLLFIIFLLAFCSSVTQQVGIEKTYTEIFAKRIIRDKITTTAQHFVFYFTDNFFLYPKSFSS